MTKFLILDIIESTNKEEIKWQLKLKKLNCKKGNSYQKYSYTMKEKEEVDKLSPGNTVLLDMNLCREI